ncbi:hypothetical protein M426DRAFT_322074 [Hypoxylon sp. CI-4A]|nr:hypothetical protein M426DRAFT_322074 [Hypoxylon sp. CI-4A]
MQTNPIPSAGPSRCCCCGEPDQFLSSNERTNELELLPLGPTRKFTLRTVHGDVVHGVRA